MPIYSTHVCINYIIIQRLRFPSDFRLHYITATSQRMVKCSMPLPFGAVGCPRFAVCDVTFPGNAYHLIVFLQLSKMYGTCHYCKHTSKKHDSDRDTF